MYDLTKLKTTLERFNVKCSICGLINFTVEENPSCFNTVDLKTTSVGMGNGFTAAVIACDDCGHVMLFRASQFQ